MKQSRLFSKAGIVLLLSIHTFPWTWGFLTPTAKDRSGPWFVRLQAIHKPRVMGVAMMMRGVSRTSDAAGQIQNPASADDAMFTAAPSSRRCRTIAGGLPSDDNDDDKDTVRGSARERSDKTVHALQLLASGMLSAAIGSTTLVTEPAWAAAATAAQPVPSALWAYAHYASILVIFGCLSAERTLVKAGMSEQEEELVIKLDLVYGVMAAILIISGLFRATDFGKGSEFYLHETLFWVKMTLAGIWGGLSIFPSLTFYKRGLARRKEQEEENGQDVVSVPPVSDKLAARLIQIINAELTAVISIPLVASLMARGVWYWDDFPWPAGLILAIVATVGSFYFYGKQALTWVEDNDTESSSSSKKDEAVTAVTRN